MPSSSWPPAARNTRKVAWTGWVILIFRAVMAA